MMTLTICAAMLSLAQPKAMGPARFGDLEHGAEIKVMRVIDGKLYVGGRFERVDRKLANNIAVWDGTAWSTLGKGVDAPVRDICAVGKTIYACGDFSYVNKGKQDEGTPAYQIAKWDGTKWSPLAPKTVDNKVYALATDGTNLYIGGNFSKINDETETRSVCKWDGKKLTAIGGQFDRYIMSMTWFNGKLYAGGAFNEFGDDACSKVAVWDGKTWTECGSGGLNGSVNYLMNDGKNVYAAGEFQVGGSYGVAKLDAGKWVSAVKTGESTMFVHVQDGIIYVAGDLNSVNGKNTHNVAIVNGGKVTTIDELMYGHHWAIVPYGDKVFIGGNYADTQIANIGGVLKWDGEKNPKQLTPVSN